MPERIAKKLDSRQKYFQTNPFNPILKTHALTGLLKGYWAFSVDFHYRVLFRFGEISENEKTVYFVDIGTHEIYR